MRRILVSALSLSAAAFISLAVSEGYVEDAAVPTKNDRATAGFGSTYYPDGSPVKLGDKMDPVRALIVAGAHISKEEQGFRESLPGVELFQAEYDVYMDWVYQYGVGRWRQSSMRKNLLDKEYRLACDALLKYRFSGGYDCSVPGNKICSGVWTRQLARHQKCIGAQAMEKP